MMTMPHEYLDDPDIRQLHKDMLEEMGTYQWLNEVKLEGILHKNNAEGYTIW